MKPITIKDAMQRVADNPVMTTDELIQVPVHELVCRNLFEIANNPDSSVRGAAQRANRARKMILDRLVGKRRAGSHPATRVEAKIDFVDLTVAELPEGAETGEEAPA